MNDTRKRMISAVLCSAMLMAALPCEAYAADSSTSEAAESAETAALRAAITDVKKRIDIPKELTEFDYETNTEYETTYYNFRWYVQSEDEYGEMQTDKSIAVEYYNGFIKVYQYYDRAREMYSSKPSFPKMTPQEQEKAVMAHLKRLFPDQKGNIVIERESSENELLSSTVHYSFSRKESGIDLNKNYGSMTVDRDTGKLLYYNLVWWNDAKLPDASKRLSEKQVSEIYASRKPLDVSYRLFTKINYDRENNKYNYTDFVLPVYYSKVYGENEIDAITGKYTSYYDDREKYSYTSAYSWGYYDPYDDDDDMWAAGEGVDGEGDVIEDDREYLTDEELQALEKENSFISEEKARKLIKDCKYIRFNKELVLSKAYLSNYVDTNGEIRPSKVFNYEYTTDDETKDSISLSVKMDAYSGKIISFSKSYGYGDKSPNKITEPVKYDKALPIAKEAAEYFAEDIAEEYRPNSAWEKDSESVSSNVWFTRYVNDIPAYFDDMSVSVNSNGEVLGFEYDYHKLDFPEPDLVGTEAAYEKLFEKMKPELYYTGFTDLQLRSHVYLTYRFDEDFLINALTGERITGSGEQYYTDKMYKAEDVKEPKLYTDIKGHKYEKEISTLWDYGVRISDNEKLGPDEPITVSEFEKLIGYTEYDGYFNYFSNHIYQSIRQETEDGSGYTLLRNPKLDKALTYGDLAKLYVLMYEDECYTAAGIKGIYAPPFENIPTSDPDCGYIAIAKAKGLIKDGRRFDKNKTITRADALKIYYDYISGNKVKDIKSIFAV